MSIQFPLTLGYAQKCRNDILSRLKHSAQPRKISLAELQEMRRQTSKRQTDLTKLVSANHKEISKYFMTFNPLKCNSATFADLKAFGGPKIAINNNKLYIGTIVDGKRHGKGLIISQKGKIYEGELLLNERNGCGVEIYEDGNFYIGNFVNNRRSGEGRMVWVIKIEEQIRFQYYSGEWKDGEPHGVGVHYTDEWIYIGNFKNGFRYGKGIEQKGNKLYEGFYANNLKQGKGIEIDEGKQFYEGEFKGDLKSGYGKWRSLRGEDQYEGFYVNNKKQGIGVLSKPKQFTYRGLFTDDNPNGTGQYINHYHTQVQNVKDERVATQFVIKNNHVKKRGELQSAQFIRSNLNNNGNGNEQTFKSQMSLKSIHKLSSRPPSNKASRQKQQESLPEHSKLKLRKRTSLSSAKVLKVSVDNAQKHACTYKHCSCHKWKQSQPQKGKIDEKRLLRLFSGRKTLLKNII